MKDNSSFSARLKRYRLSRLWTLTQMANVTGLTAPTIWKLERGMCKPHELTVAKIERACPDMAEQRDEVTA